MFSMFGEDVEAHTASMVNSVAAAYSDAGANFDGYNLVVHLKSQVTFVDPAMFAASIDVRSHSNTECKSCSVESRGTTCAPDILTAFSDWRGANFMANDGAHLLTNIDFDGEVIGLAFIGVVCSR
jgi:hypothetical protein